MGKKESRVFVSAREEERQHRRAHDHSNVLLFHLALAALLLALPRAVGISLLGPKKWHAEGVCTEKGGVRRESEKLKEKPEQRERERESLLTPQDL